MNGLLWSHLVTCDTSSHWSGANLVQVNLTKNTKHSVNNTRRWGSVSYTMFLNMVSKALSNHWQASYSHRHPRKTFECLGNGTVTLYWVPPILLLSRNLHSSRGDASWHVIKHINKMNLLQFVLRRINNMVMDKETLWGKAWSIEDGGWGRTSSRRYLSWALNNEHSKQTQGGEEFPVNSEARRSF